MISRRGLIGGLAAVITAPAIVRASSLMPIKALAPIDPFSAWTTITKPWPQGVTAVNMLWMDGDLILEPIYPEMLFEAV